MWVTLREGIAGLIIALLIIYSTPFWLILGILDIFACFVTARTNDERMGLTPSYMHWVARTVKMIFRLT